MRAATRRTLILDAMKRSGEAFIIGRLDELITDCLASEGIMLTRRSVAHTRSWRQYRRALKLITRITQRRQRALGL